MSEETEPADKQEEAVDPSKHYYLLYKDPESEEGTRSRFPLKNLPFIKRELMRVCKENTAFAGQSAKLVTYIPFTLEGSTSFNESVVVEGPVSYIIEFLEKHTMPADQAMQAFARFVASMAEQSDLKIASVICVLDDPEVGLTPKSFTIPFNGAGKEALMCFNNAAHVHLEKFEADCREKGHDLRRQPGDDIIRPGDGLYRGPT